MVREITHGSFLRDFSEKAAERRTPFEVSFELTHRCNLNCRHCYIPSADRARAAESRQGELSSVEIASILDQLAALGCFYLDLTGGEALTRPDIVSIVAHAKKRGFYVALLSNATLITPDLADRLKDLAIDQVAVSLHAMTQATYEAVTRVPGSFEKCLRGIQWLRERKIPLCLTLTVTTLNAAELAGVKAFARDIGARFQWGQLLFPAIDGSRDPLALRPSPETVLGLEAMNQPGLFEGAWGGREENERGSCPDRLFQCNAGKNSLAITARGELILCLPYRFPKYDLRRGSLANGWKRLVDHVESSKPSPKYACRRCDLRAFCQWCPAEGWLHQGDRNACVPYFRELAKMRKAWTHRS